MSKQVHIVNGDSTATILKESDLSGDLIVWREMLCEGPLSKNIGSDSFWNLRYAFFENEFQVNRPEYYDNTIEELIQIEDLSNYDEVVLWFEFDLFCQVNLIALCTYLLNHFKKDIRYYLVCVGTEKNKEKLQTLSDYTPTEYQQLHKERIKLTRRDLLFAKECWEKYVDNNSKELKEFNFQKNSKFNYLHAAIQQHLKRFADGTTLSQIDLKLLETIYTNTFSERDIVRAMLIWQKKETVYGFGDLQYFKSLEKLHPCYEIKNEHYYLNDKGKSFLSTK
jgi:hypothetical protein